MSKIRMIFLSLEQPLIILFYFFFFLGGGGGGGGGSGFLNECQQTIFFKNGLIVVDKGEFQTKVINRNTFRYPCQIYCRCFKP